MVNANNKHMNENLDNELLKEVAKEVSSCDRCGACLPECPLFRFRDVEIASARGKNAIARALAEGGIKPSIEVLQAVNFCLLCHACTDACPNKIRTDEAMTKLRQLLMDITGRHDKKHKAAALILNCRALVNLFTHVFAAIRLLHFYGLLPSWISVEEYSRDKALSELAGPATFGSIALPTEFALRKYTKIAYFQGCAMKMFFPEASKDTQKLLESTGKLMRKKNFCCGLPHLAHGMRRRFLNLIEENIRLYEDADIVVSDCASCSNTLKKSYNYFADDPMLRQPAADFSDKIMDLTEYLFRVGYSSRKRLPVTLTYHDPCHLARGQKVIKEPRALLQTAGNFVEMKDPSLCCGGAGLFHLDYPDVSAKIMAQKLKNIQDSDAQLVATACPGCLIQLSQAAKYSSGKFKVVHISQVLS